MVDVALSKPKRHGLLVMVLSDSLMGALAWFSCGYEAHRGDVKRRAPAGVDEPVNMTGECMGDLRGSVPRTVFNPASSIVTFAYLDYCSKFIVK